MIHWSPGNSVHCNAGKPESLGAAMVAGKRGLNSLKLQAPFCILKESPQKRGSKKEEAKKIPFAT